MTIGNSSTLSTTLFGNVRSFTYTISVSATGYTQVIANTTVGNPLYTTSGVWMISANATSITNQASGLSLSATAYVATNSAYPSYVNVFGAMSSVGSLSITGGTIAGAITGYGIYLNIGSSVAYGTYRVNFLQIN